MDVLSGITHDGDMARFAYYRQLSKRDKRIYRQSDEYDAVVLDAPEELWPLRVSVGEALRADDRVEVEATTRTLSDALCSMLNVPFARVRVHAERPRDEYEELHGLYTPEEDESALIELWMRTAALGNVVALRTYVRTLVHELVHHLDYELLELDDSFHTEGFFQRESSLMRQVFPESPASPQAAVPETAVPETAVQKGQLCLPLNTECQLLQRP